MNPREQFKFEERRLLFQTLRTTMVTLAIIVGALLLLWLVQPAHGSEPQGWEDYVRTSRELHPKTPPPTKGDRAVRIFTNCTEDTCHLRTGSTVKAEQLLTILFTQAPCTEKVVGREFMFRAWQNIAGWQLGCWYPTSDQKYVIFNGLGQLSRGRVYWEMLPRAVLHPDGTATITEPNYSPTDYTARINEQKLVELMNQRHQQP